MRQKQTGHNFISDTEVQYIKHMQFSDQTLEFQ